MEVINKVSPSEEQIKGFFEPGAEGPIYMLNLLKFKDKAEYEDGSETDSYRGASLCTLWC